MAASELGVLDFERRTSSRRGVCSRARCSSSTSARGRLVGDDEIKHEVASQKPYAHWLEGNKLDLASLPAPPPRRRCRAEERRRRLRAAGYSREDLRVLLAPMASSGEEPHGQHGQRRAARGAQRAPAAPLPVLQAAVRAGHQPADRSHPREARDDARRAASAARATSSPRRRAQCRLLELEQPILTNEELAKLVGRRPRRTSRCASCRCSSMPPAIRSARSRPRSSSFAGRREGRRRRGEHPGPQRPRRRSRARGDPEPARDERGAPRPGADRQAHARGAGGRDGRGARGRRRGAAHRLRRRGGQSVPRLRGDRRARRRDAARRAGACTTSTRSTRASSRS